MYPGIISLQNKCVNSHPEEFNREYMELRNKTILGQVWAHETQKEIKDLSVLFSGSSKNQFRNRYTDVPAFEDTRVKINIEEPKISTPDYDEPPGDGETADSDLGAKAKFMGLMGLGCRKGDRKNKMEPDDARFAPSDYINANYRKLN